MENKDKYVLVMDSSAFNLYGKCPLAWAYANRENLQLTGASTNALDKGSLVHLILEAYYKAKLKYPTKDTNIHAQLAIDAWLTSPDVDKHKKDEDIDHIKMRFIEYVYYWMNRDLIPIERNGAVGVELGFSKTLYENDNVLFVVEGKIDLLNDMGNRVLAFTDHKSQSRQNNLYFYRPQMKTYAWATGLNHCMINYFGLQKEFKKDVTFRREFFEVPNWMISQWEKKMIHISYEIHKSEKVKLISNGYASNEDVFERNFSSCSGAFDSTPCQYTSLCETNDIEMRNNIKSFKFYKREEWIPWRHQTGIEV